MTNKQLGLCAIFFLLVVAVYCEFKIGNTIINAILDVVLVFAVFYVEQRNTKRKMASLQDQLHELQERIGLYESTDANHNSPDDSNKSIPTSKVLWEHAVKR